MRVRDQVETIAILPQGVFPMQRYRSRRRFAAVCASCIAFLILAHAVPAIDILVTHEEAMRFFDNMPAKVAYVVPGSGGGVRYIDFSVDPLEERVISADGGGNIQICPEGRRVAFTKGDQVWIGYADDSGTEPFMVTDGINGHWWVHPETGKTWLLVQRGIELADTHGIFGVELGADDRPAGAPVMVIDEPMANAGRSADGKFFANNDEESTCGRGHGIYEVSPATGTSGLSIEHWVYLSAEGWYSGGIEYGGYCNGAMCPAGPGKPYYGAALHMGSGHTSIFIRKPADYAVMPLVELNAPNCPYQSEVIHYTASPDISIGPPKHVGLTRGYSNWGYSDWSTHHDYITATGGNAKKSKGNQSGYIMNLSRGVGHARFGIRFSDGGVAQPDLWVSDEGVSVGLLSPLNRESFGNGATITLEASAYTHQGTITSVEYYNGEELLATVSQAPWTWQWESPPDGDYNLTAKATNSAGDNGESPVVSIEVRGEPVLGAVRITPFSHIIAPGETYDFNAEAYDQYGYRLSAQPALSWSVSGGGDIDVNGVFTAGAETGVFSVVATMQHENRTVVDEADVYICSKIYRINFQKSTQAFLPGFIVDDGSAYRALGPLEYGWSADNTEHARNRHGSQPVEYRTLNHMQWGDQSYTWELALPASRYAVGVCAGDIGYFSPMKIIAEDVTLVDSATTLEDLHIEAYEALEVADGRLTLSTEPGYGTKICFAIVGEMGTREQSGDEPLTLLTDVAGKSFGVGHAMTLAWKANRQLGSGIIIEVSVDNGRSWHRIQEGESLPMTTTDYVWTIPATLGIAQTPAVTDQARLRVCEYDGSCSAQSALFSIIDPSRARPVVDAAGLADRIAVRQAGAQTALRVHTAAPAMLQAVDAKGKTVLRVQRLTPGVHMLAFPEPVAEGFLFVELRGREGRRLCQKVLYK